MWAIIGFYPDYTAEHPLWLADGLANLDELHLPEDLDSRLRKWADSWESHFHWDSGWVPGHPKSWWVEEEALLPRELATSLGADFAVAVAGGFIHSKAALQF